MDAQAENVLRTALSLDATDRAEIAASLIQSLDSQRDEEVDAAWAQEINRRIDSLEKDEAELIPSEEVMRSMRERLNG
jgi:putative addiction module component (TIGR02574 family)